MSGITIKSCCLKRFPLILKNFKLNLSSQTDPLKLKTVAIAYKKYETTSKNKNSPVVILHGLFGSKSNWNSLCKAMASNGGLNRDIIAIDARDHGESPHTTEFTYHHLAADVNRLFTDLKIDKACVIGHSMGGRTMMLFALLFPEKAEKLIVVDISPFESSNSVSGMKYYFDALKSIQIPPGIPISEGRKKADIQLQKFVDDKDIRQFLLTNLVKYEDGKFGWRVNLDVVSSSFEENVVKFPLDPKLKYEKPTLFIGGIHSDYISESDEKPIKKIFPAAKFVYLDCGHWVHSEKPQEFLEIATKFIKSK